MLVYEKYIFKKLAAVFLLTVVFFTAILFVFNIFRIANRLAAGLQFSIVLKLFAYLIPSLLGFSIPFGALVACLLVYGRLSAQNEILALRASGVSLYRTASAMMLLGVATLLLSLAVFGVVAPKGQFAVRQLRTELGRINPLFLFEPGETTTISGYSFYLGKKSGNRLYDVDISHVDKERVTMRIKAKWAILRHDKNAGTISLELHDVKGTMRKRGGDNLWEEKSKVMVIDFNVAEAIAKVKVPKDESDLTFRELLARARLARETGGDVGLYTTEFHKRLVFCFACLSFAFIGTPLGIKVHRGEKTVGFSIALGLAMAFYTVVMFAERLRESPHVHPLVVMWTPNVVLLLLGLLFFRRIQRGIG